MRIYLNEKAQDILKNENKQIELRCILFSIYEKEEFKVIPGAFNGGFIEKKSCKLENGKCAFSIILGFDHDKNNIISNETVCVIDININEKKIQFKIIFLQPKFEIFSDEYFLHFGIKGKNKLDENWKPLSKNSVNSQFYVTPFDCSKDEIDYQNIKSPIKDLTFYYIQSRYGTITSSQLYNKNILVEKHYLPSYFTPDEYQVCFALKYKDLWYPLIESEVYLSYNELYFESGIEIKNQVIYNNNDWIEKIKKVGAYGDIKKLNYQNNTVRNEDFYKQYELIYKRKVKEIIKNFKKEIKGYETIAQSKDLTFEGLAYHIMFNPNNSINELHKSFPGDIQEKLKKDFIYYNNSNKDEEKDLALYNYILKLEKIFKDKKQEFDNKYQKIKLDLPDVLEEQKNLLISYYSINPTLLPDKPKILINYENQIE